MNSFVLKEWDTLRYGAGADQIPQNLADRLVETTKTSLLSRRSGNGVIEHHRHHLRARGVVGVVANEACSLEILPKIDTKASGDERIQNGEIRKRLVSMLSVALDLKIDLGRITDLSWQNQTLLEILIRVFCDKLVDAVRRGMPRAYTNVEDDIAALRGRLNVTRQFTTHAVNPSRLACSFDVLSADTELNRVMKATVRHLSKVSRSSGNQRKLRELNFVYDEVEDKDARSLRWDTIILDRTNSRWRELLGFARMFLSNQYQTTSSGRGQGISMLFEMNVLFEEYIGRMLRRAVIGTDFQVALQGGRLFCLRDATDGVQSFQTKPDIIIRRNGEIVHIIDTKWKRISSRADDPKQGVSQSDVYQMMAYGNLYHSARLTLLYPHHSGLKEPEGVQGRFQVTGHDMCLETATIDIGRSADILERLRAILRQDPAYAC